MNGIYFPSKLEAALYTQLLLREKAGEIKEIQCQYSVLVKDRCPHCGDGPYRWKVDFSALDAITDERLYFEAKGKEDSLYLRKKKMWKRNPPGKLEIWKGSHKNLKLSEVIK